MAEQIEQMGTVLETHQKVGFCIISSIVTWWLHLASFICISFLYLNLLGSSIVLPNSNLKSCVKSMIPRFGNAVI